MFGSRGLSGIAWPAVVVAMALVGFCSLALCRQAAAAPCPNDEVRTGPSAVLPDCRAYELVTPSDTNGRSFFWLATRAPYNMFPTQLTTSSGNSLLFLTDGTPLADPSGANGTKDLYQAQRSEAGWDTSRRLTPSGNQATIPLIGGVSSDHSYGFINVEADGGALGEGGDTSYLSNPDDTFEVLGIGELGEERLAQGRFISEDGAHVIFTTGEGAAWCSKEPCAVKQLETEAAPTGTPAIYDRSPDGPTRVISLLPGEEPLDAGQAALYQGTSITGSAVAFKVAGDLYVRVDNAETKAVTTEPSVFAGLSEEGTILHYVSSGNIFRFSVATSQTSQITTSGDAELVNISRDGSHLYFLSKSLLDGPNGIAGQPNLYAWSVDAPVIRYVATVATSDLAASSIDYDHLPALNTWTDWAVSPSAERGPGANSSRSTPDGEVLVFQSHAELTSTPTGGHASIYRYDGVSHTIQCVSCPSSGTVSADARLEALYTPELGNGVSQNVINNLTEDGSRVFFETSGALLDRDVDGVNDIYEWQIDEGGARLDLISSGTTTHYLPPSSELHFTEPNSILAITPDGGDVFFFTNDQLLPSAGQGGTPAIYDARVGGGFPVPALPPTCVPEDCQPGPTPPLGIVVPQSDRVASSGNVKPRCKRRARSSSVHRKKSPCRKSRKHRRRHRR
jgi:hypothetical protein